MNILFIHQNYPGQFRHLAPALLQRGDDVRALSCRFDKPVEIDGVKVHPYRIRGGLPEGGHPWAREFETRLLRAQSCAQEALRLRQAGYVPDLIIGHYGWGETQFLKHIWPEARMGLYCELHYDPDHESNRAERSETEELSFRLKMRVRNVNGLLHQDLMDAGLCPTRFQLSSYPPEWRERITLQHDGIDTGLSRPDPDVRFSLPSGRALTRADEVITYVSRSLEPMRGFDVFMEALPDLLRARPNAEIVVVGREDVSYGAHPPGGGSWKTYLLGKIASRLAPGDLDRVHFLGNIPHDQFRAFLQVSRVHIYLTRPFVVSWGLMEAMATGCAIVASDVTPVREVIPSGEMAELIKFPDPNALVEAVSELAENETRRHAMGQAARAHIVDHYDLKSICLPAQIAWVDGLAALPPRAPGP
ncbi:MAG: glycosyl transferase [Rhodobacterales bacterium]|nr:MAG: glycosyl transferase [Rhodobacterales bacterium]